ncbi:MAG: N-6 DNA methylase, partial [Deltaproteobacteria bacterium]
PSVLFSKGAGAKIRSRWIQEDIIESIITLPVGMWQPVTNLAPVILVLNKGKVYSERKAIFFMQIEGEEFIKPVPKSRGRKTLSDEGISKILTQFKWAKEHIDPEFSCSQAFVNRVFDRGSDGLEKDGYDLRPKQFLEEEIVVQKRLQPIIFRSIVEKGMKRHREAEVRLDNLLAKHFGISFSLEEIAPLTEEQRALFREFSKKHQDELDEN